MKLPLMLALVGLGLGLAAPVRAAALEPQPGLTYVEPTPPYRDYLPQLKTTTVFQDIAEDELIALLEAMGPKVLKLKDGERPQTWDRNRFLILLKAVPADDRPGPDLVPRRFKWDMPKENEPGRLIWAIPALSGYHQALGLAFDPPPNQRRADIEALEVTGEMLTGDYGAQLAPAQGRMVRNLLGMLAQQITDIRQMYNLAGSGRDMYAPRPAAKEEKKSDSPAGPAGLKGLYVTEGPEATFREFLPEMKTSTIFQDIPDKDLIKMLETMKPGIALMKRDSLLGGPDPDYYRIILRRLPAQEQKPRRFKYAMPNYGEPGMMMAEIPGLAQYLVTLGQTMGGPRPGQIRDHDLYLLDVHQDLFTNYFNEEILPAQRRMWRNYLGILAQKVLDVRRGLLYRYEGLDLYAPPADDQTVK
jgi:hypothetical protein